MYQVVITRELLVSFVGNELIIGIILLAWLLLVAAGSAVGGRLSTRRATPGLLAGSELALAPLMAGGLVLARLAGQQGQFPGQIASPLSALALTAAALAPACLVLGAQFALGCALLEGISERGASAVYVLEATGAVAAGVLFHFLVADHLNVVAAVSGLCALNCVLACWVAAAAERGGAAVAAGALAAACIVPAAWPAVTHGIDRALMQVRWKRDLVAWTNTRYGLWSVSRQHDQLTFSHDGVPAFATGPQQDAESVHIALAAHPQPRRVLMIGGGPPAVREALKHPVREVHYVELDRRGIEFVWRHVPAKLAAALSDPRLHLHFTDGRAFLKAADRHYDVIAADLPDPTTAVINRYYTQEAFREARRALREGGVLMTTLSSPRTTLTGERRLTVGGVWRALGESFSERAVLPIGERLYFLAGDNAGAGSIAQQLEKRDVETQFLTPFTLEAALNPLACEMALEAVREAADAPTNTDFRPVAYHLQMRLWARQFWPRAELGWLSRVGEAARTAAWGLTALALLAALTLSRRGSYRRIAVGAAILIIGLLEMAVQLVVLFAFQAIAGYLYHQIGLLMTLNMLGLALGAMLARTQKDTWRPALFAGISGIFVALCVSFPWLMAVSSAIPALATVVLGFVALAASLLTGAAFPLGVGLMGGREARAASSLYALDLVGGAAGAAAVSVLLVPMMGLPATARLLAVLGGAALVASLPLIARR
ncbi:MAG: hypothetical protein U9R79_05810 [Armatimonadota bacterium]|nr:hypothetical protein [Armatimonadota bacterium]